MDALFLFLIGVGVGLVLGWVFLPEPTFVRRFFSRRGWATPTVTPSGTTPASPPTFKR